MEFATHFKVLNMNAHTHSNFCVLNRQPESIIFSKDIIVCGFFTISIYCHKSSLAPGNRKYIEIKSFHIVSDFIFYLLMYEFNPIRIIRCHSLKYEVLEIQPKFLYSMSNIFNFRNSLMQREVLQKKSLNGEMT